MDISIIVPHKNSTALLERLLLSIPDTKKTEIIIVDDQSEKEEKEKLKSFISKYKINNAKELFELEIIELIGE